MAFAASAVGACVTLPDAHGPPVPRECDGSAAVRHWRAMWGFALRALLGASMRTRAALQACHVQLWDLAIVQ